jgi:hypothetical protein
VKEGGREGSGWECSGVKEEEEEEVSDLVE